MSLTLKKKLLIIIPAVLVVVLLVLGGLFVYGQMNRAAVKTDDKITSAYFEVTVPEDAVITGDSKKGNVYATIPREYGELRVSLVRTNMNVTQISQRGEITESSVVIDGVPATQKTIDYTNVVRGTSEKLLIRYEVSIDRINKPSNETYSTAEVTAMSKRPLTASEKAQVRSDAEAIIKSLKIK